MRTTWTRPLIALLLVGGCSKKSNQAEPAPEPELATAAPAMVAPPPLDPNNIVSIASASNDHKTLVAALKAADYVAAIANPGPLTVFAPTDAAFAKLPAGTVDNLVKPENQPQLKEVLKYHATTSVYEAAQLTDGKILAMANGAKVTIHVKDGKIMVNDATIIASVRASNGVVHVVDTVLLPPKAP